MPTEPLALGIEHFDAARHDRADFDCGVGRLNNYLKLSTRKQRRDDMARVYVVVEEGSARILGYHAINLGMMNVDELERRPRGAPDHGEIPVLFLGQVAVDKAAQGSDLGGILVHHIFEKACMVSDVAGCHAIILDVISDGGEDAFARRKAWYEDFGFATFASDPARMFLAMKQVRAAVRARREDLTKQGAIQRRPRLRRQRGAPARAPSRRGAGARRGHGADHRRGAPTGLRPLDFAEKRLQRSAEEVLGKSVRAGVSSPRGRSLSPRIDLDGDVKQLDAVP